MAHRSRVVTPVTCPSARVGLTAAAETAAGSPGTAQDQQHTTTAEAQATEAEAPEARRAKHSTHSEQQQGDEPADSRLRPGQGSGGCLCLTRRYP